MAKQAKKQKQRIAYTYNPNEGSSTSEEMESFLLVGDPDYEDYKCEALPQLLEEGYMVRTIKGNGAGEWLVVLDVPE
jgi:alpha-glucuronidase